MAGEATDRGQQHAPAGDPQTMALAGPAEGTNTFGLNKRSQNTEELCTLGSHQKVRAMNTARRGNEKADGNRGSCHGLP